MKGSQTTYSDFKKSKIEELQGLRAEKKAINEQRDALSHKIETLQAERDSLQKSLPPGKDNQNPEFLLKTIEELNRRYETTSMKPQEEKKVMADIKKLKDNIPNAKRLLEIKPLLDKLFEQRKEVSKQFGAIRDEIDTKSASLDAVRKEQDEAREQRDDTRGQLDQLQANIETVRTELNGFYEQKDQLREEFHRAKFEFELENDLIRHNEWIAREKERLLFKQREKEERLAQKRAMLDNRPNPYKKEIDTCESLILYCDHLKKKFGLVQTDESIKEETKQIINSLAKEDVRKKIEDRKIEQVMSKKEREEAAMIKVGGGGKKGGKKPKQKGAAAEELEDPFQTIDI
jgi:uncharacterized coiled-coil DUF342 family protein